MDRLAAEFGFTTHIRSRGEEAQALKRQAGYRARRWVVERTHSWLTRFRRILVCWEKRPDTYLAMLRLTCTLTTWRAANWCQGQVKGAPVSATEKVHQRASPSLSDCCPSGGVAKRRSLSGGHDAGAPLAQAVALALERDHGGVVDEPVDQRGGHHGVAEDLGLEPSSES